MQDVLGVILIDQKQEANGLEGRQWQLLICTSYLDADCSLQEVKRSLQTLTGNQLAIRLNDLGIQCSDDVANCCFPVGRPG